MMQKTTQKKEYDIALRNKALTGLVLRAVIAGYMLYLAWKLMSNMLNGSGSIPELIVWLVCIVFAAVALGFCVYTWKEFRKSMKAAQVSSSHQEIHIDSASETGIQMDDESTEAEDL